MMGFDVHNHLFDGELLAVSLQRSRVKAPRHGVDFVTEPTLSQQLAIINQPAGKQIARHVHTLFPREVKYTQETLVIVKGLLRVDLYDSHKRLRDSFVLGAGDVILLVSGGHGFSILEDCLMIEVKQGPYNPDQDKERF